MDIISLLPPEVCLIIFECLPVEDLGRCLRVSKCWRNVANENYLWKRHCISYGIEAPDPPPEPVSDGLLLCYWALVWRRFGITGAFKWHSNKYNLYTLLRDDYTSLSLCENRFTVYSPSFNNLDVFIVEKDSKRVKLLTSLALSIPKDEEVVLVSMNNNYIIAAKHNIILVFQKIDSGYDLHKVFAILLDSVIHAVRGFTEFVNTNLNISLPVTEVIGILDNYLWLCIDFDETIVINICSNEVTNIFSYESYAIQGKFFTTWSDEEIRLYNNAGNLEASVDNVIGLEEVYTNGTLTTVLRGDPTEESLIEVWDLRTGASIFSKKMSAYTWTKLHPKEDILYTLEASCHHYIYRITAWDVKSGNRMWVFEDTSDSFISYWELHVVCEKYLVIWPSSNGVKNFYLIDAKSGKIIYEKSRPLCELNFISDSLWISITHDKKVSVRSYI